MQIMSPLVVILLLVTQLSLGQSSQVRDRFPGSRMPVLSHCRVSLPPSVALEQLQMEEHGRLFVARMTAANCSFVHHTWNGAGRLDANGSYDGIAGILQRDEADWTPSLFRTDFFEVDAVRLLSRGIPADIVILSRKNESYVKQLDLLTLWTSSFDWQIVWFSLVAIALTIACSTLIATAGVPQVRDIVKRITCAVAGVASSFVGHSSSGHTSSADRVLFSSVSLFALFIIQGILFGCMGADQVAVITPPAIESVDEFSLDSFTQPVILRQLFFMPMIAHAIPGSQLHNLSRILLSRPCSLVSADLSLPVAALAEIADQHLQAVRESREAVLFPVIGYPFVKCIICRMHPEVGRGISRSKATFFPGILSVPLSLKADPLLRQLMELLVSSLIDLGLHDGFVRYAQLRFPAALGLSGSDRDCLPEISRRLRILPFPLAFFSQILSLWAAAVGIACALLCVERLASHLRHRILRACRATRRWRRATRRRWVRPPWLAKLAVLRRCCKKSRVTPETRS